MCVYIYKFLLFLEYVYTNQKLDIAHKLRLVVVLVNGMDLITWRLYVLEFNFRLASKEIIHILREKFISLHIYPYFFPSCDFFVLFFRQIA